MTNIIATKILTMMTGGKRFWIGLKFWDCKIFTCVR